MLTKEYKIKKIDLGSDGTGYKIIDTRNPHVSQHPDFFSTRAKAKAAMRKMCWGESVCGDI